MKVITVCPGCKVELPHNPTLFVSSGGFDRYGVASPECLALFNEVLAKELEYAKRVEGRIAVHPYAVQHPPHEEYQLKEGISERLRAASRQSVAIHLLALYGLIEKGGRANSGEVINRALSSGIRFEDLLLEPPADLGNIKVVDISKARNQEDFNQFVTEWVHAAWAAWSKYHELVRDWYKKFR